MEAQHLQWVKEVFSNQYVITDGEKQVGYLNRGHFRFDVIGELNEVKLNFDMEGFFLNRHVNIHDLTNGNAIVAVIKLKIGHSAYIEFSSGEKYTWNRKNFLMKDWSIVYDLPNTNNDPIVINYHRTKRFFSDEGNIDLLENSPKSEILMLAGLFIRNYFLKRRRRAAVVAIAVS